MYTCVGAACPQTGTCVWHCGRWHASLALASRSAVQAGSPAGALVPGCGKSTFCTNVTTFIQILTTSPWRVEQVLFFAKCNQTATKTVGRATIAMLSTCGPAILHWKRVSVVVCHGVHQALSRAHWWPVPDLPITATCVSWYRSHGRRMCLLLRAGMRCFQQRALPNMQTNTPKPKPERVTPCSPCRTCACHTTRQGAPPLTARTSC